MEKFMSHAFQNLLRLLFESELKNQNYPRCWHSRLRNEIKKLSEAYL